jgi:hypothetical protein
VWVAEGRELPIQDRCQLTLVDEVVAGAEVGMDETDPARRRCVELEPAQRPLQHRLRHLHGVEVVAILRDARQRR